MFVSIIQTLISIKNVRFASFNVDIGKTNVRFVSFNVDIGKMNVQFASINVDIDKINVWLASINVDIDKINVWFVNSNLKIDKTKKQQTKMLTCTLSFDAGFTASLDNMLATSISTNPVLNRKLTE